MNTHAQHEHNWFATSLTNQSLVDVLKKTTLIITDVDGCLTDATKHISSDETHAKRFHMRDGLGIHILQQAGIHLAFVSGDSTPTTRTRAKKLGVPDSLCHFVPWAEKPDTIQKIQYDLGYTKEHTLIIGDDISDTALCPYAALFACPADAPFYVQHRATLVSPHPGGYGAIRPLIDLLLFVQKKHPQQSLIEDAL